MKTILFMIHDLGPGGAEKVLVNLVNHMDHSRFHITVMSLFGGGVNEQCLCKDVRLINCHKRAFRGNSHIMKLFTPHQLFNFYVKDHYDIIVSFLEGPSARIASGCTAPDTNLVSWVHIAQNHPSIAARAFRTYREAVHCYSRFHQTVCVSESVKTDFCALFPHVSNVCVLSNTVDTAQILEAAKAVPRNFPADPSRFHLIAMGKLVPTKGFDRIARIHKRLVDAGYPVHTYILGEGSQRRSIQRYLDSHDLSGSFTLLGYQSNPYQYLSRCELFLCASHAEGCSTAATEALILGIPVITVRVSGMDELLGGGTYGIITENSEDALFCGIRKLLDDPALLAHYRQLAALRGRDFHTQNTVTAIESMLEKL